MTGPTFQRIALLATLLALGVVMLGAYVRLSDAGLGCPDWPVCYGHLAWPTEDEHIARANEAFPERPVEVHKAWKEQVHRFFAASLGVLVLTLALMANWQRAGRRALILVSAAAAAAGTVLYVKQALLVSSLLSALSVLLPMIGVFAWKDHWAGRFTAGLLALIIVQAALGMWTVTLLVKPIIVTGHLLGGMATLALLFLLTLRSGKSVTAAPPRRLALLRTGALVGLCVLLVQIFLGAWTSTNYAALACPDFPTCQTHWWPPTDFTEAFTLWRGLGVNYEFGVLENTPRVTIHLTHRIGALITAAVLLGLVVLPLLREQAGRLKALGALVLAALLLQITVGISVVWLHLPLPVAVAHNGGAALLLLSLVAANSAVRPPRMERER